MNTMKKILFILGVLSIVLISVLSAGCFGTPAYQPTVSYQPTTTTDPIVGDWSGTWYDSDLKAGGYTDFYVYTDGTAYWPSIDYNGETYPMGKVFWIPAGNLKYTFYMSKYDYEHDLFPCPAYLSNDKHTLHLTRGPTLLTLYKI